MIKHNQEKKKKIKWAQVLIWSFFDRFSAVIFR